MKAVWAAWAWRVGMSWGQLRSELRALVRDLAVVGWCQLRGRHFIEPDICGRLWRDEHGTNGVIHEWCERCGWCTTERERRPELVGVACEDRGREEVLP